MRPADSPPLFHDHPLRRSLNDEAHARPFAPVDTPSRVSSFVLLGAEPEAQRRALLVLTQALGLPEPSPGAVHYLAHGDGYALRWNGHTEFVRYSVLTTGGDIQDLSHTALDALPAELLSTLPGSMLVGVHAWVLPCEDTDPPPLPEIADWAFGGYPPVGAEIGDGRAVALTDLRLHPDPRSASGFARLLVYNRDMAPNQTGRMLQRLIELETYRMLALLALPVAKRLQPTLSQMEAELKAVTGAMSEHDDPGADDSVLLDRITRLAAELEDAIAQSSYRFAATRAYYKLVCRRIEELREGRLPGLQPFQEFVERRLAPAIDTCEAVERRLELLSMRLQRATALLRTRVEVDSDAQRRELLVSMNRRAALQLRLQETVEGLSVAVLTYYVVGLIGYAAKGLKAAGLHVQPDLVTGVAIPITAAGVAFGVHRLKRRLTRKA